MQSLTFQVGDESVALDIRSVVEVVPHVRLRQPAGRPPWLAGLFVYRGQVVPVIDLFRLTGVGNCPTDLSSRIILVQMPGGDPKHFLGLLAARVANLRDVPASVGAALSVTHAGQPDLGPLVADGSDMLRLLDLKRLLPRDYLSVALTATETAG